MEGSAFPSNRAIWISRPWMYSSITQVPPNATPASSAARSSWRVWAMETPMEEPLALGFTTQGSMSCSVRAGISSAVYVTACQAGVTTPRGATSFLVRSLFIAMPLLK